jgi:esterase
MLHFYSRGSGSRNIVLLHGFLGSGRNLMSLATRLSERDPSLRLLVPDLTGHGSSPRLPKNADLTTLAADVWTWCDEANIKAPSVIGHSLGGRVALKMAEQRVLQHIVLLDISPGSHRLYPDIDIVVDALKSAPAAVASRQHMRDYFIGRGLSSGLTDWLLLNLQREQELWTWKVDVQALCALQQQFRKDDLWDVAKRIGKGLSCIRGGDSSFVTDDDVAQLRALGANVDSVPGAGHFLHVDALDAVASHIANIL